MTLLRPLPWNKIPDPASALLARIGTWTPAVIGCAGLAAIFAGLMTARVPETMSQMLVLAAVAIFGGAAAIHLLGRQRIGELSVYIGVLTIGWNDVRALSWMTVSDVFLVVAVVMLATTPSSRPRDLMRIQTPLLGVGLIVLGGLLGSYFSTDIDASLSRLLRFGVSAFGTLLLFYLWNPSRPQVERVLWLFIASACVSTVYALGFEPDDRYLTRAAGIATHPNHFALIAVLAAGPCLAFCWREGKTRPVALAALILLLAAVALSGSRAGIVGLMSIVIVMTFTVRGASLWAGIHIAVLAGIVLTISGVINVPSLSSIDRLLSLESPAVAESNEQRSELLADSISVINSRPLTGSGFENSRLAHNIYIQILSSAGLVGLAGFIWLLAKTAVLPLFREWSLLKAQDPVVLGVLAALIAYLVAGAFGNQIWDRYIWFVIGLASLITSLTGVGPASEADETPAITSTSRRARTQARAGVR